MNRILFVVLFFLNVMIISCDKSSVDPESQISGGSGILRNSTPHVDIVFYDFSNNTEGEDGDIFSVLGYSLNLISMDPITYEALWAFGFGTNLNALITMRDSTSMNEVVDIPDVYNFYSDVTISGFDTLVLHEQATAIEEKLLMHTFIVRTQEGDFVKFQLSHFKFNFGLFPYYICYFDWEYMYE